MWGVGEGFYVWNSCQISCPEFLLGNNSAYKWKADESRWKQETWCESFLFFEKEIICSLFTGCSYILHVQKLSGKQEVVTLNME